MTLPGSLGDALILAFPFVDKALQISTLSPVDREPSFILQGVEPVTVDELPGVLEESGVTNPG
jgi:hypothetical protein